jgi:hypothetical protein
LWLVRCLCLGFNRLFVHLSRMHLLNIDLSPCHPSLLMHTHRCLPSHSMSPRLQFSPAPLTLLSTITIGRSLAYFQPWAPSPTLPAHTLASAFHHPRCSFLGSAFRVCFPTPSLLCTPLLVKKHPGAVMLWYIINVNKVPLQCYIYTGSAKQAFLQTLFRRTF